MPRHKVPYKQQWTLDRPLWSTDAHLLTVLRTIQVTLCAHRLERSMPFTYYTHNLLHLLHIFEFAPYEWLTLIVIIIISRIYRKHRSQAQEIISWKSLVTRKMTCTNISTTAYHRTSIIKWWWWWWTFHFCINGLLSLQSDLVRNIVWQCGCRRTSYVGCLYCQTTNSIQAVKVKNR